MVIREACLLTGAIVLGSCAVLGAAGAIGYVWWLVLEHVIAPRIGTNRLFFETAARILDERKVPDTNQLDRRSKWRWPL